MNLSPEMKKALEEQKKQCPFCKIVAGEIPSNKIYEDDTFLGILDIHPATSGHVLFMPKEHYPLIAYLDPTQFQNFFKTAHEVGKAVKKALLSGGINLFIASGGVAGQQSGHFMIHLIPRDDGDGLGCFELKMDKKHPPEKLDQTTQLLAHNLPLMMQKNLPKHGVHDV